MLVTAHQYKSSVSPVDFQLLLQQVGMTVILEQYKSTANQPVQLFFGPRVIGSH
jgi:hypothetical protein